MRKIALLLFLSIFVSMINAAGMPIELNHAHSSAVESSVHEYCHEMASISHHEGDASKSKASTSHYCCSSLAVLTSAPVFGAVKQSDAYITSASLVAISNIAESIYKPPKNYL